MSSETSGASDNQVHPFEVDAESEILPQISVKSHSTSKVTLQFEGLEYSVPIGKDESKTILRGVCGEAYPGEILAIMGPSGSGKSSLLSILSGSIPINYELKGTVTANGKRLGKRFTKKVAGFVQQDDLLYSNLTVKETLDFSARLRLANKMTTEEQNLQVDTVIAELGLRKVQDTFIGNEMVRGVSGGERKRVSIASELIREVSVLLLDEPTSGLDSFMALSVMETLKDLARSKGITIITTIHQPRSQIWGICDRLLLLSEGQVMYNGPAPDAVSYFSKIGYECPKLFNPADYFLDIVSLDFRTADAEKETRERIAMFAETYQKSRTSGLKVESDENVSEEMYVPSKPPFTLQFYMLVRRAWLQLSRDKISTVVKLCETLFFAFLIGGIYFDLDNGQNAVQDRAGLLFFASINQSFGPLLSAILRFVTERDIFRRENRLGFYGSSAYYFGKSLAELPITLFFPFIFSTIIYWMTGLQNSTEKYFKFVAALVLVAFTSESIGLAIGTFAPNGAIGNVLGISTAIIAVIFAGLYVNPDSLHPVFSWIEKIDFLKFAYRAVMNNEFEGLEFTCSSKDLTVDSGGNLVCPIETGENVLQSFSFDGASVGLDLLYLFIVGLVFRAIAYIVLRITKAKMKRV